MGSFFARLGIHCNYLSKICCIRAISSAKISDKDKVKMLETV
jgi:hypothetical protein